MTIFITGAAGYIGGMLVERFAQRDDVEEVICLDKNQITQELKSLQKVLYIRANTADDTWQDIVADRKPDIVIHCAWQIREFYFRKKLQERWNINGSRNVFEFALGEEGVIPSLSRDPVKLIHFSSVAVYGAYPGNRIDRPFTESDPMREHEYRYGVEKKQSEEMLMNLHKSSSSQPSVTVLRICSVTGQRYRAAKRGFTLQNMLAFLPFIPVANPEWGRQFIHEDELLGVIDSVIREQGEPGTYSALNVAPSPFIKAAEIIRMYGKKALPVPKELMRLAFFILRHCSLGRIPTSRGGWRFYVYPVAVDGSASLKKFLVDHVA